ncbi:sugar ABC transporter ATP-binding protein [Paenibacillus soyae]|uniref:Sugar ABC transporter ATP-binding protein n=1 Tax=Paenibacillus soyae TaxID=2969249 RepID=A0A9X2SE73_9BACL|nr:sugar ABC transporter ATP-binding protein [Paenibacillus soyae]MCR2807907.1 sugar ABC transporter ATP-binding protein [Paenibacillus soyae]
MEPLVVMEDIVKQFPGVLALDRCRFELRRGEVHALVGENGAGKSTMMKILTGVYAKDGGRILYKGSEADIPDTRAAQGLGIGIIHQELHLMPDLTIAQNIFIGREPRRKLPLLLDDRAINAKTEALLRQLNLRLDPEEKVSDLTVAKQQMVEIAKALSFESEVLIMDEPTAALTASEIEELFRVIGELKSRGVGIVYISHRMDELKRITDRITVMRDGCYVNTVPTEGTAVDDIIAMMVGRQLYAESKPKPAARTNQETVLEVRGLNRKGALRDVSFHLNRGEIVGFAGLMGAGRTETARAVFGADPIDSGDILIHGEPARIKGPDDAVRHGIGYLSEDRKQFGLLVEMDVKTNLSIASYDGFRSRLGWMRQTRMEQNARKHVEGLRIKTPSIDQLVKYLSGGNQQKIIIGKWLTRDCDILIIDEPTRGIDVGAKAEIYKLLDELAQQGKTIMMISSELPEILRMSHRVIVMCEGRITGELSGEEATQEGIMKLATMREEAAG